MRLISIRCGQIHAFFTILFIIFSWATVCLAQCPFSQIIVIEKGIIKDAFKKDTFLWEDIEKKHPFTLVDVLKNVNGIYLTQNGGAASASSIFLRGGNPNHTLVISDGMRVMDPTVINGSFNPGIWAASDFDTLDVKKGPLSSLHGGDAVAGVISTEMEKGHAQKTTLSTLHGSFDTHLIDLTTKGAHNRFYYNVRANGFKTQGYAVTPSYLRSSPRQSLNDPSQIANLHGRFDADVNEHVSVTYTSHLQTHRDDHYRQETNPFWVGRSQHTHNVLTLHLNKKLTQRLNYRQKLLGGFLKTKRHDANPFMPFNLSYRHQGERRQMTWQHELSYDIYKFLGEMEYMQESLKSYHIQEKRLLDGAEKAYTRSFLLSPSMDKPLPYNQSIALKGSLRFDHHSQFKGLTTFMSGAEYELPTATRLSVYYGTAYKAPTLYQLNVNTTYFKSNKELKPETSHGIQYGLSQRFTPSMKADVYYFKNKVKRLITSVNQGNAWVYHNHSHAIIKGIESSITLILMKAWNIKLAHTHLSTYDAETHLPLKRRPKNMWHMDISHSTKSIEVGIHLYYKSRGLDTDPIHFKTVPGKSNKSVDGYVTYHAMPKIDVFMKIENMLSYKRQQDPLGYLRPGMSMYGGMKIIIG